MNNYLYISLISISLFLSGFGCKPQSKKYEIRKVFIETDKLPIGIKQCIVGKFTNEADTLYNFTKSKPEDGDSIIYRFLDADSLPSTNLLDGTRKISLVLFNEKDSVGNPYYAVESYASERSQWKRTWNLGRTSFYNDTLLTDDNICGILFEWLNFHNWKGLP